MNPITPMTKAADELTPLPDIQGVLFDLDGVLYVGDRVIDGAVDVVALVQAAGLARRFITNTSTLSQAALLGKLRNLGFTVAPEELLSAPQAAAAYLRERAVGKSVHLLLADNVKGDFDNFSQVSLESADCIVVGDIGDAWSYALLDRIFNRLVAGAQLIVIHKNRFWQTERGLRMDVGGFVAALEYCSGAEAVVMGKPSPEFFRVALRDLGLLAGEVAIVGDDIQSDIDGGQRAGLKGVLVRTGKYRQAHVEASGIEVDRVIDSIADLPRLLGLSAPS